MTDTPGALMPPSQAIEIIPPTFVPECNEGGQIELLSALFAFQQAVDPIAKVSENPHLHSTYADLATIWQAIRQPLFDNGLLVLQEPHPHHEGAMVTTTVVHVPSGEWRRSTLFIPAGKNHAQAFGSALTYARRYPLMCVLGLNPVDDDGHAAQGPGVQQDKADRRAEQDRKGWEAWTMAKELQLRGCEGSEQLADAWRGMQPDLKKAPEDLRDKLTAVKDAAKLRELMESEPDIGGDVPQ